MNVSRETAYCAFCPRMCRFACPVAEATHRETHTPWGKQRVLYEISTGMIGLDDEAARCFYACCDCRRSRTYCVHGIEAAASLFEGRAAARRAGLGPLPAWLERNLEAGNPFGRDLAACRSAVDSSTADPGSDTVWLPGCTLLVHDPGTASSLMRVAAAAGLPVAFPGEGPDCGPYMEEALGRTDRADLRGAEVLEALGGRRAVVGCPACLAGLRRRAGGGAGATRPDGLLSVVEFLDEATRRLGPRLRLPGGGAALAYHDPCHPGRLGAEAQSARRVLGRIAGLTRRELPECGVDSRCTGGGGALPATFPLTSYRILLRRVEDFARSGAGGIVTGCPTCVRRFRRRLAEDRVEHLATLVQRCLA